jgi:hypothetical protein
VKRKYISYWEGIRLSIDWIHNLVYYNFDKKIIVFNMTHTRYEFVVIEEEECYILDLSVNPLDSVIFYSIYNWTEKKGKIMKSSEDGSNRTVLRVENIGCPSVLTIDLVLKKVIWFDRHLKTFASIDFEGNDFLTFGAYNNSKYYAFMEKFGDYIYWTQYNEKSIFKTKLGLNDTQINYLITSKTNEFGPFKIIDSSLQPNSTNRCINHNCSHLCIPISIDQYHCVCPQFRPENGSKICKESVST